MTSRIIDNKVKNCSSLGGDGQAMIMLVSFVAIGIAIITTSLIINFLQTSATGKTSQGQSALSVAEAGIENSMLRLLRNPNYTGETLAVDTGTVVTTVTGTNPKTITAVGTTGQFKRKLMITVTDNNGTLTITSWKEI